MRRWLTERLPKHRSSPLCHAAAAAALLEEPAPFDGAISQKIAADVTDSTFSPTRSQTRPTPLYGSSSSVSRTYRRPPGG